MPTLQVDSLPIKLSGKPSKVEEGPILQKCNVFTIIICFILKMARKLLLYFGVNLLSKSLVMILFEGLPLHSEKCISHVYIA